MPRQTRAYTQWTADTEIAFVMALRFHGRATLAAAEIGRTVAGAYLRRNRLPDFAARWEDALDQWRRANTRDARDAAALDDDDRPPNPPHFDGWTTIRRRAFLRALGEGGNVEAACAHVHLSVDGAYGLRRRDPKFAAAWDRALAQSSAVLEQVAFERAVDGVEEEVWHAGKVVGTRRRFSEPLMRQLIGDHSRKGRDDAAAKAKAKAAKLSARRAERLAIARGHRPDPSIKQVSIEEVEAALLKNLDGLARGQRQAAAQVVVAAAARAEMWLKEGKVP